MFTIIGVKTNKKYFIIGPVILIAIIIVCAVLFSKNSHNNDIKDDPPTGRVSECQQFASSYIGLNEQDAIAKANKDNVTYRVTERNGEGLPSTMDYSPNRLNFAVTNNKIVSANCG